MTARDVPLIDIGGFADGRAEDRRRIAGAVARAVEDIGFLAITGHGVPEALMRRVSGSFAAFFDLPLETKRRFANPSRNINRGYVPYGEEFVAASHDADAPADWREAYAFGRFVTGGDPYFARPEARYAYEANILPDVMPPLVEAAGAFYGALGALNDRLLRIFAAALDLEDGFFLDKFDKHASVLRAINYPEQDRPPAPGQLRCGAHTDFGTHTLLMIDDAPGGLQCLGRDRDWIDVAPPPGSFVVNIGDLMMVWTNDRWLSNLHRVVNPPPSAAAGTRRQSIAFFVQPNYDALIECIETCREDGKDPRHEPVRAWEHRHAKLSKTTIEHNA